MDTYNNRRRQINPRAAHIDFTIFPRLSNPKLIAFWCGPSEKKLSTYTQQKLTCCTASKTIMQPYMYRRCSLSVIIRLTDTITQHHQHHPFLLHLPFIGAIKCLSHTHSLPSLLHLRWNSQKRKKRRASGSSQRAQRSHSPKTNNDVLATIHCYTIESNWNLINYLSASKTMYKRFPWGLVYLVFKLINDNGGKRRFLFLKLFSKGN